MQRFRKFYFIRRNRRRKGVINFTLPKRSDAKKKRNVAVSVNTVGGNGRSVGQVKKRWTDMKSAVIDQQRRSMTTGGGCPLPEIHYEDVIR